MSYKLIITLGLFLLAGCSDNSQPPQTTTETNVQTTNIDPSTFSENKKKFMAGMCGEGSPLSLEACYCSYDSMDRILSKHIGKNWMSKSIMAEDEAAWDEALNTAAQECGTEIRNS